MKFRERLSTLNILITLIVLLILNIVLVMFNETILYLNCNLIGVSEKSELLKILGITLAGFLLMIQANIANRRVIGTEKGLEQERLKNAIEHLGDEKTSIRIGGLFELYHLAKEVKGFRGTICDIICSYIKDFTSDLDYQKKFERKCSSDIQIALNQLFIDKTFTNYRKYLTDCYLVGANFHGKEINDTRFHNSQVHEVSFSFAVLTKVWFVNNSFKETKFNHAKLNNCWFRNCYDFTNMTFLSGKIFNTQFDNVENENILEGVEIKNVEFRNN